MTKEDLIANPKKRGRRKIDDYEYFSITNEKITEWEVLIESGKLSSQEKKILKNRISAQKSRMKKKEEIGGLAS